MFSSYFSGKRVLVTGHTGFQGAWISTWLHSLGAKVYGYSLSVPSQPSLFETAKLTERVDHTFGDLRDFERLHRRVQEVAPEVIFHFAAQALVRPSYEDPKGTFDTNIGGTINLLESLRLTQGRSNVLVMTSDKCYENVEVEGKRYVEEDPLGGHDPYSTSKAGTELVARAYFRSFFSQSDLVKLVTVRAGNVIGGGDWAQNRLVADCFRAWSEGQTVKLRSPKAQRPWQHVLEAVGGCLRLMSALGTSSTLNGQSFNFGPDREREATTVELVELLKAEWPGAQLSVEPDHTRHEATHLSLSAEKARRLLEWQCALSTKEAVALTGRWYRKFYARPEDAWMITQEQINEYARLAFDRGAHWLKPN